MPPSSHADRAAETGGRYRGTAADDFARPVSRKPAFDDTLDGHRHVSFGGEVHHRVAPRS